MLFDIHGVAVLFVAAIDFLLGAVILFQTQKNNTTKAYALFATSVSLWGLGVGSFLLLDPSNTQLTNFLARFLYLMGGSIPATFLFFTKFYAAKKPPGLLTVVLIFTPTLIFIPLYFFTDLLIAGVTVSGAGLKTFAYGPLHFLFDSHLWGFFTIALAELIRKIRNSLDRVRNHLILITLGTYSVLAIAGVSNVIYPSILHISDYIWIGPAATFIWVLIIAYAVARFQLFDIRVVVTEVFVFAFILALAARVLFSSSIQETWINLAFLGLVVIIGVALIRNVIREVEARNQIQHLADDLRKANERLKELDRMKSQFLSIASHDLRAPLTVIRNFMSLLLDGTYGKLPPAGEEGLHQVFDRATDMAKSVDTYLNVSRIEQGRMKYDFIAVEFAPIVEKAVKDFTPNAEAKAVKLSLTIAPDVRGKKANLDVPKINEVLNNLLDNSIKYTPKGSIAVTLEKRGTVARLMTQDTGVGMSAETISKLFQLFSTGADSKRINVSSTGVGLYITKAHVEAHKGRIWAESDGEGKGARFIMELPLLP